MGNVVQLKASIRERASRVRALLKSRDKAEAEIAAILRELLDELGEAKWLACCEKEFGWARRAAYNHLNPTQMEAHRARQQEQRAHRVHIEPAEPDIEDEPEGADALGELAAANRGWYNRAREAAQYARYAPVDTCPVEQRTIEAIKDAIAAWSDVLSNVTKREHK